MQVVPRNTILRSDSRTMATLPKRVKSSVASLVEIALHLVAGRAILCRLGRPLGLRLLLVGLGHELRDPLAILDGREPPLRLVAIETVQQAAVGERIDNLDRARPD